jgi:hypothetical protein
MLVASENNRPSSRARRQSSPAAMGVVERVQKQHPLEEVVGVVPSVDGVAEADGVARHMTRNREMTVASAPPVRSCTRADVSGLVGSM